MRRKGDIPDAAPSAGFRRLPGSLVQITVFLTGLALTFSAYAILSLLIGQMISGDFQQFRAATRDGVILRIQGVEETINGVASLVHLMPEKSGRSLSKAVGDTFGDMAAFERLLILTQNKGGEWVSEDILVNDSGEISPVFLNGMVRVVAARAMKQNIEGRLIVLDDLPGTQYWQESGDPVIKSRPFAIAKPLYSGGRPVSIIVGISRISRLIERSWLEQRPSLLRLAVREKDAGQRLYYMGRDNRSGEDIFFENEGGTLTFPFGDVQWQVNLLVGESMQVRLLGYAPWLILVFGAVLTLMGVLFVRNNQRQSYAFSALNRELAYKNYTLGSEVAERERLNLSLRKAEREYRAIVDSVSDIIFETNASGEIVFLNSAWEKVTGIPGEEVIGRNLFELLHPHDREEQRESFDALVKGRQGAYRGVTRLQSTAGRHRSVELAVSMLRQDENRALRVVGTITDVEERRRAEQALSEVEKKYRTIVENAAGGIYQVTQDGQFLSANPAMARILGYDSAEQIMQEVGNAHEKLYVNARARARFVRELEAAGYVHNFETEARRRDGTNIWINENARVVKDDEGAVLYYEGSMEDVTARKRAELDLRKAMTQSDLASRAKSEFLANMSHELRTPLNTIIGFSEIIKDEVLGPMGNRQYWEYSKDIHSSGQRLLGIINEILDVSRIEAGERHLNEGLVRFDGLVKSCVDFMAPKAEAAKLRINNMTAGRLPDLVGEELAIKQMLLNLLGNAVKFTPVEGRITLSHEIDGKGRLRFSVTDTGVGMEEYEIEKALSPFGQLQTDLNRSVSGAGLGLTLVESLIRLHGGELEIFSQKGLGTTVTLVFPARRVAGDVQGDGKGSGSVKRDSSDQAHK